MLLPTRCVVGYWSAIGIITRLKAYVTYKNNGEGKNMIKVFIVDDHMILREGIKRVLADASDIIIAGEADNDEDALHALKRSHYDVVLMDLVFPYIEGLDLLRRFKKLKQDLPVLILSYFPEDQFAMRVLKEGASGYLTKKNVPNDLIDAVRKVVGGRKYISTSLAESLVCSMTGEKKSQPHEYLSSREFQIFSMITTGKSVKEMSHELSLARTTITSYRTRIFDKLKFKTNADLIRYAVENRIV
jgi:two-component system, NarL family, invasion response regulator UvrY